ncbi:MAG: hypothetical protein CL483_03905 [Acidobacteria bacterium]|nr:hypothetical protein [Acidobacteriota bacterium]
MLSTRYLFFTLKALVSALALSWVFSRVDLGVVLRTSIELGAGPLVSVVLLSASSVFLASIRWRYIIANLDTAITVSTGKSFALSIIGSFFNLTLPGVIAGDTLRASLLYKASGDLQAATSSFLIDRCLGLLTLLLMGSLAIPLAPLELHHAGATHLLAALAILSTGLLAALSHFKPLSTHNVIGCVYRHISSLFSNAAKLLVVFALSILIHLVVTLAIYTLSGELHAGVTYFTFILILPLAQLVSALPLSIGGLGLREGALVALLGYLEVAPETAVSISLTWYLASVIASSPGCVLLVLWRKH